MDSVHIDGTYPPLETLKPVADGLWIVDSGPIHILGLAIPIRMTVVRLTSGDMWLHSPTRYSKDLHKQLEQHGPIRHLIAPDVAHWSFLHDWQRAAPEALTSAAPGLRERRNVRKAGIKIDHILSDSAPQFWSADLEQLTVRGLSFSEVDFFHRASRTLIMTDLIQNLDAERMPAVGRILAKLNGVAAPNGRAPLYLRAALRMKKQQASHAATQMVQWAPERVIFSHGRWFDHNGTEALQRSLDWLLPTKSVER
jgi:Domain of unknown function (DUF4336)